MSEESVVKSGITWFEASAMRGSKGLELWIKTDPRVEEFMRGLGTGRSDNLEAYARPVWFAVEKGVDLKIYAMDQKDINITNGDYTLSSVGTGLVDEKTGRLNLTFLRLVGVGSPEGLRFLVPGPFSKTYVNDLLKRITQNTRRLIQEYVVPVNVNLRITSMEA